MVKIVSKPGPSPKCSKGGPLKKSKTTKKKAKKRTLLAYSPSKVKIALDQIKNHGMRLALASKMYGVPRATLWNKINDRAPEESGHVGFLSILPQETEMEIERWLLQMSDRGFPVEPNFLLDSVKQIVTSKNIKNNFTENRPGRKWFEGYLRRHPSISKKKAEGLTSSRAKITEAGIRHWFNEAETLLKADHPSEEIAEVLRDPKRIFNLDETALFMSPKGGSIMGRRGKAVYNISKNNEKTCITTLLCVNANGDIAPPCALFPYKRLPASISDKAPAYWGVGITPKGWMTGESFLNYFSNVFLPYLKEKKIPFPVIVFLDGHSTHLTMHLHQLCITNKIILVALPPNTTHLMQPLDVSVFRPLKNKWKTVVRQWRIDTGEEVCKENFCLVADKAIFTANLTKSIKAGFRATGLYPFNPDAINYGKLIKSGDCAALDTTKTKASSSHLEYLESKIDDDLLVDFKKTFIKKMDWEGGMEASLLYDTWFSFKVDENDCEIEDDEEIVDEEIVDEEIVDEEIVDEEKVDEPTLEKMIEEAEIIFQDDIQTALDDLSELGVMRPENDESPPIESNQVIVFADIHPSPLSRCKNDVKCKRNILKDLTAVEPEEKTTAVTSRRKPALKMPCVMTSTNWREYHNKKEQDKLQKEEDKRKRKEDRELKKEIKQRNQEQLTKRRNGNKKSELNSKEDDWICVICKESYYEEEKMKISQTWIECDSCHRPFHYHCIPRRYLNAWDITLEYVKSGNIDFQCHLCTEEDDEL